MRIIFKKIARYCVVLLTLTILSACSQKNMNKIPSVDGIFNKENPPKKTIPEYPNNVQAEPLFHAKKYKVALFLPLESKSTPIKQVSTSLLNAARLAQQEVNNQNMDLIIYAIGDNNDTIITAAQRAVTDKVDLIIGPLLSPSVVTARQYTEPAGIPMLALSSDQTSVSGGFSYLLSYLPEQNVANIVNYAASQGHQKYGLFASNTPYGKRASDTFIQEVTVRKGVVTNAVYFNENAPDFYEKTKEISETEIRSTDATPTSWTSILLPDRASLIMQTLPLFSRHNINFNKILILGTGIWDDPRILEIEELNNAVFAAPNQQTLKIFEGRYQTAYKEKPTLIASLAYDAVALASGLIRQYPNAPFSIDNLTNPNGFTGVGGIFRFRPDGLSERGLSILRIQNKKFNVVIPAPDTFSGS
jgi:ABC-type branched-subunit amino acid transport system substrate-binding protein